MNIKDTIDAMESKLKEIDVLFDASIEAENAGESFKAHGIAKDAEKLANDLEKLVDDMDCSDLDELLQDESEMEMEDTIEFLVDKVNILNELVMDYARDSRDGNELEAHNKLKKIKQVGIEIAYVSDKK